MARRVNRQHSRTRPTTLRRPLWTPPSLAQDPLALTMLRKLPLEIRSSPLVAELALRLASRIGTALHASAGTSPSRTRTRTAAKCSSRSPAAAAAFAAAKPLSPGRVPIGHGYPSAVTTMPTSASAKKPLAQLERS